jgi:hypothetical protein
VSVSDHAVSGGQCLHLGGSPAMFSVTDSAGIVTFVNRN